MVLTFGDTIENLTDSYNYTPYGTIREHNGTSENNFLFTGEQRDSETDDYYLRARYYSPSSGRFISRDSYDGTLDNPLSQNHYLYTHGNPVNYTDPTGNMSMMESVGVISLSGVLAGGASYTLFYGGSNGQGIVGDAWDAVIDSYFNTFYLYFAMYELIEGDNSTRSDEEQAQSDIEHDAYKEYCDGQRPRRSHFHPKTGGCEFQKERLKHARQCLDMVKEFDAKWEESDHTDSRIKDMEDVIRDALKQINKFWGCEE